MTLYTNNGRLKYNLKRLAALSASTPAIVEEVIGEKFQVADGFISHKRVDYELEDGRKRHEKAIKAAKARWGDQKQG